MDISPNRPWPGRFTHWKRKRWRKRTDEQRRRWTDG